MTFDSKLKIKTLGPDKRETVEEGVKPHIMRPYKSARRAK